MMRPAEVDHLLGDASKARAELGWTPSVDFKQLIEMMVDADLALLRSTTSNISTISPGAPVPAR